MAGNQLAKNYSARALFRFTLPTIVMTIFMALYTMVDGIFVSRLIGTGALSAVNIILPFISFVAAVGIMLAAGGSAFIAMQMGEGNERGARENFTALMILSLLLSLLIVLFTLLFFDPLLRFLGANEAIWDYCRDYAWMLLLFTPLCILQVMMQFFFVTAGRPSLGLVLTVVGGLANVLLDYLLIKTAGMGIAGAGLATGIGYGIPALVGLLFFSLHRKGSLYFVRPKFRPRVLLHSCVNGSSEMVTHCSMAIITLLYNRILMELLGEEGVAAIAIILYAEYLLVSLYLGYSTGVAPIISYKHGEGNEEQLRYVFKLSIRFICISSLAIFLCSILFNHGIVGIFVTRDQPVWTLASRGFYLYAFAFLLKGVNIFASVLFTALNNGLISALLSFLRSFVFLFLSLTVLPKLLGLDGVWISVAVAEVLALLVSLSFVIGLRRRYRYA